MHTIQLSRSAQLLDDQALRVVSATSMSAEAEVRAMVRPDVPNYAARRLVVGLAATVAVLVVAVASVGALAGMGGSPAAASAAAATRGLAPAAMVADSGDTLWSIAVEHRGDVGHDRYLEALIRKNGGTDIRVGQVVWLP